MQHLGTESWRHFNDELRQQTGGWFFVSEQYCDDSEAALYECCVDSAGHTNGVFPHGVFATPDVARAYLADLLRESE